MEQRVTEQRELRLLREAKSLKYDLMLKMRESGFTYRRFFDEFQHAGEFDVPFDREFLHTAAFEELTDRLHVDSAKRFRDSWVACDACDRWREIPPTQSLAGVRARETWRCEYAFPGLGCDAPLTDREFKAFSRVFYKGGKTYLKPERSRRGSAAPAAPRVCRRC